MAILLEYIRDQISKELINKIHIKKKGSFIMDYRFNYDDAIVNYQVVEINGIKCLDRKSVV